MRRRRDSGSDPSAGGRSWLPFTRRRRLVLFVGVAAFLLGGALDAEVLAAAGTVIALAALLVWSYVRPLFDGLHDARQRLAVWRLRLSRRLDSGDTTDPTDRLRDRYADGELSEAEFEERMELVLQTDDDEVARNFAEDDTELATERR